MRERAARCPGEDKAMSASQQRPGGQPCRGGCSGRAAVRYGILTSGQGDRISTKSAPRRAE